MIKNPYAYFIFTLITIILLAFTMGQLVGVAGWFTGVFGALWVTVGLKRNWFGDL